MEENASLEISNDNDETKQTNLTVKQIRNLQADFQEVLVTCEVTVKKIDEKVSWYYSKCTGCKLEIYRENGIFKCTNCPRIVPYPDKRFRMCTLCSDNTGSIAIILPDSEVIRITDTTVVDIHAECEEVANEDKFPDILKVLLNQKYKITIELNEENKKKVSTVYEAKEISECFETCDNFESNKEVMMEIEDTLPMKDFGIEENEEQTPQTGNSTNVKTRKRNNTEPVLYNSIDKVNIQPKKNIKKEKK